MNGKSFSGATLEKALKEGALAHTPASLIGMVKPAEKSGHVSFSQADCDAWVDLPIDMIDRADHVGQRPCRDHSHPIMRLTLREPKDPEGRILSALLMPQAAPSPMSMGGFEGPHLHAGGQAQLMPAGVVGSYNPWCVSRCQWECQWAGGNRLWCWYVCSWLCRPHAFEALDPGLIA
jgi:hypothetical protein